ncbi:NUDIX hydrolase [Comamonas serinivorans]|uniref:NUDIX hydrolase n=1 Tax=Comamonas serinivorans TaxID=1082851 RepID=UPI001F4411D0|nr:hypothetical protein [Comamonas serinivorans]
MTQSVHAELVAVLVAVTQGQPRVLTIQGGSLLPAGPFEAEHRSLQMGLRAWVEAQTHHPLGYVEQLYTFADRDRAYADGARIVSISYLALTREPEGDDPSGSADSQAGWQDWYRYFPWEDWREGAPAVIEAHVVPALQGWAHQVEGERAQRRWQRAAAAFGLDGSDWNEDLVLQRYELMFEAGLVPEAVRRHGPALHAPLAGLGAPMAHDHRRILATGIARLRAKIKYRPVVFELMPPAFTLLQLQQTVQALAGRVLHKQNFRRLIEQQDLVEETGALTQAGAGRPAKLFRFRRDVMLERALAGSKLPLARGG